MLNRGISHAHNAVSLRPRRIGESGDQQAFQLSSHSGMQPLAPFSADNALLCVITIDQVHTLCLALGAPGAVVLLVMLIKRKRATR